YALAPSRDGDFLATAAIDQAVHLWNLKTGKRLASLFVSRQNEWVCWTPSGHYAASAGGEKFIGWHINRPADQLSEFYPSSSFRDQFHRPDIVARTVALGDFDSALASISEGNENESLLPDSVEEILPPEVSWLLPLEARAEIGGEGEITIETRIESPGSPLQEVKLLLNGKAIASFDDATGESYDLKETFYLPRGESRLAIFSSNEHSGVTSEERFIDFVVDAAPATPTATPPAAGNRPEPDLPPEMMPNLYMLSVGVSEYAKSDLTLSFCDDDANAIADVFAQQQGRLFNKAEILRLIDGDATRDGILQGLEWLQANATQKDIILLFLAAHGMNEGRNYYLVPHDGDFESLRRTGVAWADFADILGNLPSKTLMFLDTCHSGQLGEDLYSFNTRGAARNIADATEAIRELTSDENGVVVMAASTQGESSVEHPDWGHGAFTLALIEGLQGKADFIDDGIIQLRELDTYVAERVKELSHGIQHPTTVKPSSISRFPLILIP
ncbi:MAG: caspase family protein, partial [Verrucomicrobiota bacterium]